MNTVEIPELTQEDRKRFFRSLRVTEGCWEWLLSKGVKGYGQFHIKRIPYRASRVSYKIHFGDIPDGMVICHSCDNPSCVNPAHLFLGSDADNIQDMHKKGRAGTLRGSDQKLAKLTDDQVRSILLDNRTQLEIASDYSVSRSLVGMIKQGKRWPQIFEANRPDRP